jgi:hypothetical protein
MRQPPPPLYREALPEKSLGWLKKRIATWSIATRSGRTMSMCAMPLPMASHSAAKNPKRRRRVRL